MFFFVIVQELVSYNGELFLIFLEQMHLEKFD